MVRVLILSLVLIIFIIIPLFVFVHSFHLPLYGEVVGDYLILLSGVLTVLKQEVTG